MIHAEGCNWCGGPPAGPALNSRGEECPCRCHQGCVALCECGHAESTHASGGICLGASAHVGDDGPCACLAFDRVAVLR